MRKVSLWVFLVLVLGFSSDFVQSCAADQKIQVRSLLSRNLPVMLQFGKSWCPTCKSTKPVLDSAARAYAGKAVVMPVDVEANMDLVQNFRVRLIPTQIFLMPDGKEYFRHEGILQARQIADIFGKMGLPRIDIR
jgi:thioredoxin 1